MSEAMGGPFWVIAIPDWFAPTSYVAEVGLVWDDDNRHKAVVFTDASKQRATLLLGEVWMPVSALATMRTGERRE